MKIALLCPASLPATQFGGIMFLCLDLAKEMSKLEHEVNIFTTDLDFANNPNTFNKNLPRKEKIENFFINRSHVWFSIKLFYIAPASFFQLLKFNPQIIHTIGLRSFQSIIAALVSKIKKIPLVISDQGGLTTHPDYTNGTKLKKLLYFFQKPFINFIINQATKISVANQYEKEIFEQFNAVSKVEIIQNGINLSTFDTKNIQFKQKYKISKNYFLFLGRFSKVKGIDTLIHAIHLLQNKDKLGNFQLVIMGVDFGFEKEMFEMIKKFNLSEFIKVIRQPPRDDVLAAYNESEFLVLPSRWELSPLTPLEGFVFKKAVISCNAHGIPFTIKNNENCILVTPGDSSQLADAIYDFIINKEKRKKFGESGYNQVITECNSKEMANKTLKLYNKILNE